MDDGLCYGCFEQQPDSTNAYQVCFECGHVYLTWEDLRDAHLEVMRDMGILQSDLSSLEHIKYFCACCTHDF